jgi:hypothetical protein
LARDDTTLEAAGAEHLVVGRLLIDGLQAFRAYANQAGYDLLVVDPKTRRSLKVQVKSRVAVDSGAFRIKSFDFDFVIFVRLNRGTKASRKAGQREGALAPEFYIVPKNGIPPASNDGARIPKGWLRSHAGFLENWDLIQDALADPPAD